MLIQSVNWDALGVIFGGIVALAAIVGIPITIVKIVLPRRGFAISAETDPSRQTRVSFSLRGETTRSIQEVHLAARRSWIYRLIHDESRTRDDTPTTIAARPSPGNPALPLSVGDKNKRTFVFDVQVPSQLPPKRPTTSGWEMRVPDRGEIRVYVLVDDRPFRLIKPKLIGKVFA